MGQASIIIPTLPDRTILLLLSGRDNRTAPRDSKQLSSEDFRPSAAGYFLYVSRECDNTINTTR